MTSILVTGDREWRDRAWVEAILRGFRVGARVEEMHLVEGCARGADMIAHTWGKRQRNYGGRTFHHHHFPVEPKDWKHFGKAAGPRRNELMLEKLLTLPQPRLVLAFHDDLSASKGTKHMVKIARDAGIPVRHHAHLWEKAS